MGVIWFNGVSSADLGLIVEAYPVSAHGTRRGEPQQIAGRNGYFVSEEGTFDNYVQPFAVAIREGMDRPAHLRCADVAKWLLGSSGYCRLETSFEPEHFRFARFAGPINIEQIMGRWGRCTLEFDCQPQRYLINGEKPVDVLETLWQEPWFSIKNPTGFTARPLLRMFAIGTDIRITFKIGDEENEIGLNFGDGDIIFIDCETYRAYNINGEPCDSRLSFYTGPYHEFFKLGPGHTDITTAVASSGDYDQIVEFEIIPRWWTL